MTVAGTATRKVRVKLKENDYLTDGKRLVRVYLVEADHVVVEDARTDEFERLPIDNLGDWRRVRKEAAA